MKSFLAAGLLLTSLSLTGCRDKAASPPLEPSVRDHSSALAPQKDVSLRVVTGMRGLVPHGDELMVMVFGDNNTEAEILEENTAIGDRSLHRFLLENPARSSEGKLLRIPDMEDESGTRYFYYERLAQNGWRLIAVCVGGELQNAENPPVCSVFYRIGSNTVSYELEESFLLRNHAVITQRVLLSLGLGV